LSNFYSPEAEVAVLDSRSCGNLTPPLMLEFSFQFHPSPYFAQNSKIPISTRVIIYL